MRYAFKMWNGKRMGPVGLLVALVVLAPLSPLTRAQSPPTTLPLTAVKPWVLVNNPLSNAEATFTEAPGSVTFTLGGATATVSLVGPTTITGTSNGLVFNLSMPTSLTLSDMQTGFTSVQANLLDVGCLVFSGSGITNPPKNTDTCKLTSIDQISQLHDDVSTTQQPGVQVWARVQLGVGNLSATYDVYFQWAVRTGPDAAMSDLDVVQETTYNDTYSRDVTLIADKPTLVRAYATSLTPIDNVTAVLHGSPGPESPEFPDSPLHPMKGPFPITSTKKVELPGTDDRDHIEKTFNFLLPPEWLHAGDLTLNAELQLPAGIEFDPTKTIFTETIKFVLGNTSLYIGYMPWCYQSRSNCASDQVAGYDSVIRKLYPINPKNVHYFRIFTDVAPWPEPIVEYKLDTPFGTLRIFHGDGGFKAELEKWYYFLTQNANLINIGLGERTEHLDQLAGWLPAIPSAGILLGSSDPPFSSGQGHVFMGLEAGTEAETLAHEIGHNLGLHHTNLCGGDSDLFPPWPYSTGLSQLPGFDFDSNRLVPRIQGDLMSYCDPYGISPFDVRELLKDPLLRPSPGASSQVKKPRIFAAAPGEQILISGWAQRDGSAGSLDPLYRMPADGTAPPSLDGGSHCLHFSGAAGALGDYCFKLSFQDVEDTAPLDRQYFTLLAPIPAGATSVALVAGTQQLASLTTSSAPPALTITSPQTGNAWNGGMQTIAWSATDPDNRPMVFTVFYSSDGGQGWIPMALDIKDSQFTFDPAKILGGSNVFFRVLATDGMNNTSADVGPIQVNQTPAITVPASLDFGTAVTADTHIQALTIRNPGSGPLIVSSFSIDNPAFTVVSSPDPLAIGAGETGRLSIQWIPASAGAQTATLTLASNDPANPSVTVQLSGTAMNASGCRFGLSSTAGPADGSGGVGAVFVSASADACTWTAASNASWITISAGATAAGGGTVTFTVAANPNPNKRLGALTIAGLTYTVTQAAGTAAAVPTISVSPKSLTFGTVTVGQRPATMKFAISNTGKADLDVKSITKTGDAGFSLLPAFAPLTLAAGKSADITVQFAPTAAGLVSGSLSIASDDTANPSVSVSLSGTGAASSGDGNIIRTLGYHEITRFAKEVRFSNGGMPVLSPGGGRVVYAHAPGDETDARYNHIFVLNADGSGQREVDVYKQNCFCGAIVDISADGNTVVSTDGVELRAASATGSAGKRLITNREIPYVRISPKGDKVFFIHRRGDASASDATTERGLYVINTDGSGLKQIAGPNAVASLLGTTADKVFPFATNGWSLDVSTDGTKLVFGVAAPGGERILAVNADGTGLKQVLGPVNFVNHVALSGDGAKVGYDILPPPCCSTPNEIGVVNADGINRKALATRMPDIGSANRIEMSGDGTQLLYGGTSYLYAADGSGVVQLSARGGYFSSDSAPLVTDGFGQPTMNSLATRFLYIVRDGAGVPQLATLDINPSALGDAPSITATSLTQPSIALSGASQSVVSAMIATSNTINRVSAAVLSAGITDPNVNSPVMADDGTNNGTYTGKISANCCAALGPKTVRVKAEVRDSGNRRHATAIEFGGLTVVSSAP